MEINAAAVAIERFLDTYEGVRAHQVRPSGDDVDVIKVWVEVHTADTKGFAARCEAAIRTGVPDAKPFRLHVRAEDIDTRPVKKT